MGEVWHDQEISVLWGDPKMREQAVRLPAMVRLVIENMNNQPVYWFRGWDAP